MWNRARTFKTDACRSSASAASLNSEYMRVIARRFYALAVADIRVVWRRRGESSHFGAPPPGGEPAIHDAQAALWTAGSRLRRPPMTLRMIRDRTTRGAYLDLGGVHCCRCKRLFARMLECLGEAPIGAPGLAPRHCFRNRESVLPSPPVRGRAPFRQLALGCGGQRLPRRFHPSHATGLCVHRFPHSLRGRKSGYSAGFTPAPLGFHYPGARTVCR